MAASSWKQKWKGVQVAEEPANALIRAAVRGDSLDQLIDLGAHTLLAAADADRAGLWLAENRRVESGHGRVVEAIPGPVPDQWKHLDVSTPFLRTALESSDLLLVELGVSGTMPHLGPLVGMHSAIWIPLRTRNYTFGLAMVAYERPMTHPDMDVLRARADEISLALGHLRDSRRRELASGELRAQLRLARAILCGVSVESILPQIARAARHHMQAEFIALGRGTTPPVPGEGWDGPDEWVSELHQGALLQMWRKTFYEGQISEVPGETILAMDGSPSAYASAGVNHGLDRVVAIPIEVRNRIRGVLVAGLSPAEDSSEDLARLESYALLAASALDREFAREERTAGKKTLRKIIDGSRECLVVIDERGKICEVSQAGAALLFPSWKRLDETPF